MLTITEWFKDWNTTATMWIWFIPAALLTFFSAKKMVIYASGIINKTKLGALFVGVVLVSMATSIPELITEITQGLNHTPEVGIADDIGANAFSTFIIGISAIIFGRTLFLKKIDRSTKISILISFVFSIAYTFVFFINKDLLIGKLGTFAIGLIPIIFLLAWIGTTIGSYFMSKKVLEEKRQKIASKIVPQEDEELDPFIRNMTKKRAIIGFATLSFAMLIFSLFLNISVDGIQDTYNIDKKSAGGIFLSMTTALPEAVAFIYFVRRGKSIAAVGSIIGSHVFNLSAIFYGDLAYTASPIITAPGVGQIWSISLMVTIEVGMLLIAVVFLTKVKKKWIYFISPTIIVLTYVIGWILIITLLG